MASVSSEYSQHVDIVKQLKMSDSFYEAREPYKEGFEEIYSKAKEEKVSMSTAKDFLNSLSSGELSTLQHYTLLVNEVDVDSLSDEGAYNLLLHHYEKYDFDNDGFIQNGEGKSSELIPKNIPADEKQAFVNTLNEMDEHDRFIALAFTFPPKFEIEGLSIQNTTQTQTYDYKAILANIDRILNPLPGEYRTPELLDVFRSFKESYEDNYNKIKEQKEMLSSNINNNTNIVKARMDS